MKIYTTTVTKVTEIDLMATPYMAWPEEAKNRGYSVKGSIMARVISMIKEGKWIEAKRLWVEEIERTEPLDFSGL